MTCPVRTAFICTGNACRSQMAEAIMRQLGGSRFIAASGGTHPAGYIHPVAVKAMESLKFSMVGQYSKSWNELAAAPQDIIITLCDYAASQACPQWPGHPVTVHWGLPDPSFHPGNEESRVAAALGVAWALRRRLERLAALPLETMNDDQVRVELLQLANLW